MPKIQSSEEEMVLPAWLFVLPWSPKSIGGVNEVVRNLSAEAARSQRFVPKTLVCDWSTSDPTEQVDASEGDFRLRLREPGPTLRAWKQNLAFMLHFIPTLLKLRTLIRSIEVSVINQHYAGLSGIYFATAKRLGWIDRFIISVHGSDVTAMAASDRFRARWWRWMIESSDSIVACSQSFATEVERAAPKLLANITVVHNGVDLARCEIDLTTAGPGGTAGAVFLCVATLEHKKGIDLLINAFEKIAERHPSYRLVVVGRWSAFLPQLQQQIAALSSRAPGVASRIEIVSGESHGQVLHRMQTATMMILPSRAEPFGIVLLEAGLMHVPVIASRIGGIPEIIDDGVHGLLFPVEDVDALAAAMDRLLYEPEFRSTLANALHDRVVSDFTWTSAWFDYVGLVEHAVTLPADLPAN